MLNNIINFSRRFGDEYFFEIVSHVYTALQQTNVPYQIYYGLHKIPVVVLTESHKNLILFHYDFIPDVELFLHQYILEPKNRKILLFSSQLDSEHVESDKYQIINWGSDLLLQKQAYQNLQGVMNKEFHQEKHWVSLTGHPRMHRILASILITGLGWEQYGNLRFNPCLLHDYPTWQDFKSVCNEYTGPNNQWDYLYIRGYEKIKNGSFSTPDSSNEIYDLTANDNARNFDLKLRHIYENSVFEIVNETTYNVPGYHCTEKFLNSVYGFNIPLVLGPPGIVNYLEKMGFDMFRDVVDTSYDTISSPFHRLYMCITKNQKLFTDKTFCVETWKSIYPRLYANYDFAKNKLHESCKAKTLEKFNKAVWWLKE